jgi:hypothetical protein
MNGLGRIVPALLLAAPTMAFASSLPVMGEFARCALGAAPPGLAVPLYSRIGPIGRAAPGEHP